MYDRIGSDYTARRRPDERVAARIRTALGNARVVVNVGSGSGAYEPNDRQVLAIEPSTTMIAQRGARAAPVVRAVAEALPQPDGGADAAMALLTVHHWQDQVAGLRELDRVAVDRVVILTWDQSVSERRFWMLRDYLPEIIASERARCPDLAAIEAVLGPCRVEPVPIPADCTDGFFAAYWKRPEAYLDPRVRDSISCFAQADQRMVDAAVAHLARDLASGAWAERYRSLLGLDEIDLGYRLVVATR